MQMRLNILQSGCGWMRTGLGWVGMWEWTWTFKIPISKKKTRQETKAKNIEKLKELQTLSDEEGFGFRFDATRITEGAKSET